MRLLRQKQASAARRATTRTARAKVNSAVMHTWNRLDDNGTINADPNRIHIFP
jgi:hypothetical protein